MPRELDLFPPPLLNYLGKKLTYPKHHLFLSFEDALWSIIEAYKPSRERPILYPAFFCMDVVDGLAARGYHCVPYSLDDTLSPCELAVSISTHQPSIVFLYHPLGRRIQFSEHSDFIQALPQDALFIEDSVDCLLAPEEITYKVRNHIIIDSLRKVSALQVSRVFLPDGAARLDSKYNFTYILKTTTLHWAVRILHTLGRLFPSTYLRHRKWSLFGNHSDLIGKSILGARPCIIDSFATQYIDPYSVKNRKKIVSEYFYSRLKESFEGILKFIGDTSGDMRFFALILPKGEGARIAHAIEVFNIFIDTHFDDSPHCKNLDYLLLPLSTEMTNHDVDRIINALKKLL